jgi:hypothetical protein
VQCKYGVWPQKKYGACNKTISFKRISLYIYFLHGIQIFLNYFLHNLVLMFQWPPKFYFHLLFYLGETTYSNCFAQAQHYIILYKVFQIRLCVCSAKYFWWIDMPYSFASWRALSSFLACIHHDNERRKERWDIIKAIKVLIVTRWIHHQLFLN